MCFKVAETERASESIFKVVEVKTSFFSVLLTYDLEKKSNLYYYFNIYFNVKLGAIGRFHKM